MKPGAVRKNKGNLDHIMFSFVKFLTSVLRYTGVAVQKKHLPFFFSALFLFFATATLVQAQVSLNFNNVPTLESGTALLQGARYRFANVAPGTDALVTLTTITANTQLITIDNNTSNVNRFQPTIYTTSPGAAEGYIRFDFQLVAAGTNTPRAVSGVYISAQDIDGTSGSNREFIEFIGLTNTSVAGTTTLVAKTPVAGGVSYVQQTPGTNQTGIGTGNQYEFYGQLANTTTSFTIIGGSIVGAAGCTTAVGSNNCDRLNSYTFDPASSNQPVPAPDVSITKTGPASVNQNGTITYNVTATNNGPTTAHGATVTDNVSTSLTGVTITCAASGSAVCPVTTGLTTLSNVFIPTFPSGGQVVFTISGTAPTPGTITNVATIAPPNGSTDPNIANNTSATISTTVLAAPDLTLAKSHAGDFTVGNTGTYSLTVTNAGGAASTGTITVTDTLPAGLTVNGGAAGAITEGGTNAANWTCNSNAATPQVITCTSTTAIAAAGTSVFNFPVNVGLGTAVGTNSITNNASVSGGGETNTANNAATDPTTVLSPNLTLAKSHTGSFTVGSTGNYSLTIGNSGTASTSGTITVTDTLPAGLTVNGGAAGAITEGGTNAANWTCNSNAATPQVITCTSTTAIAAAGTSVFSFPVNVGLGTAVGTNSITNNASVSGGGEATANNTNNTATDPTTVLSPNLAIAKSHTGDFVRGSTGSYSLTVSNTGTAATSGTTTVVDTLPAGLSVNAGAAGAVTTTGTNAANWTCNSNAATPQLITCTSTTAIATSGTSVFGFSVNVSSTAAASVTNSVAVSGGGEATANNTNNSATDPTATISDTDLTIAKTHTGSFTVGSSGTYTLTVSNIGVTPASGTITVTDTLPTGLTVNGGAVGAVTVGGANAASWTCNSNAATPQVITCTSSTAITASGTSVFSFPVNVGLGTAVGTNSITNNASVSGGGESNTANNTATDPTTILSPNLAIAKNHTGNFVRGTTGSYSLTVSNTGTAATSGTTTVVDTLPAGLSVNAGAAGAVTVTGANAANWTCNSNAATPQLITCTSTTAIATSGTSVFGFSVNVSTTAAASVTNSVAVSGGGEATANNTNNSATDPTTTVAPADLTLAKSHTGDFTVGNTGTYSLTVTNAGGAASTGTITVTDTLPAGLTVNGGAAGAITEGGTNAANWTCNSNAATPQVITCTSTTAIAAAGTSVFNFPVNVGLGTAVGTNSITNNASVSGGGETNTANNAATDPTTVLSPNLAIAKSHVGSFTRGSTGSYSLTVSNTGTAATSGTTTVVDTLPAGLSVNGGAAGAVTTTGTNAANWTCNSNAATPQLITCTSTTAIATSGTSVFGFSVNVSTTAAASVTNSVAVSGGGEATANNTNNSATDPTTTVAPADLILAKSHTGSFTVGNSGTYSFTVTNSGATASSGTITVTDTLPAGLTVNGGAAGAITEGGTNAANWTCNSNAATPQVITCTSTTAIAATGTSVFNFPVNVGLGTAVGTNSITNNASVSGGGETNTANNTATDPTTILSPNLTIAKSHTGSFTVGSTGNYSLTIGNSGTASTNGTITVTDTLPSGLTVNGGAAGAITEGGTNAANWTCNSNAATPQVITCTSTTAIAAAGTSVFSFPVNVGLGTAVGTNSITNNASVSGGGEATANNTNNAATDPTTVLSPNLTIAKSHTGNFTKGSTGSYTLTIGNSGTVATSGTITVVDTLPAGLTIADGAVTLSGANSANWSCNAASNIITCTSTTAIATSGSSTFDFTINVSLTAANTVTNTATVSGGGEATANNTNNTANDPTNTAAGPPNIVLLKSCPSPSNCTTAPQLPGTDITYRIQFTNTGGSGAANMTIVDGIPANMDYKIGSAAANAATTGLTFVIEYSNDYDPLNPTSATWGYTPVSGGGGASVGYDRDVKAIRWRVTSGTLSNVAPNNTGDISFTSKIR